MRKIVNFSIFSKIFEGDQSYEEMVPEFSEYNLILSSFLSTLTALLSRTKGLDREGLAKLVDDIKTAGLDAKASSLTKVFDEVVKYESPDLSPEIKNKINEIHTEIKKLEPILKELISQEETVEGKERLLDFIGKWCDKNKEVILKPEQVNESLRIFEAFKMDPRNMKNVFSSEISDLLTQANAVKTDIDATYENPTSVKLKRSLDQPKRKIDDLVEELQTGTGHGVNWSTLNRAQAKERLSYIQNSISDIVKAYTEIIFKETSYGDKINPLMVKLRAITDRINVLLSDILKTEKEEKKEESILSNVKEDDLEWAIKDFTGNINGQRKGIWYETQIIDDKGTTKFSNQLFHRFGPDLLLKDDKTSYKLENASWYSSNKEDIDNDSPEWIKIDDPKAIKILDNAYAYQLIKEIEWCIDNEKPLYNQDGDYMPSEKEMYSFVAPIDIAKNFDPVAASKRVKSKKGYDNVSTYKYDDGSDSKENADKSGGKEESKNNEGPLYLSSDLPRLKFVVDKKIFTNDNDERMWKKGDSPLTTTWFTPGSFKNPEGFVGTKKLSDYWVRLNKGYWELSGGDPEGTEPLIVKDAKLDDPGRIESFKKLVSGLDNQLEGVIKNSLDLSNYWGIGKDKTNIPANAWGSEKDVQAVIKGKDTKDERIEVTIWPDKVGGSSSSDDIVLKVYKNGGLGISDDDFSDNIWGNWKVDTDENKFVVEWTMYSKGDSSYNAGWKPISDYSKGKIGAVTKFSGPLKDGLKPVLDSAMNRFIGVFY